MINLGTTPPITLEFPKRNDPDQAASPIAVRRFDG
jgi:hypothetical protein